MLYLVGLGLNESDIGLLLTRTLLGDTLVSLYLTTQADRIGRRRMLIAGAALMVAAGLAFASTRQLWLLVIAGTIGVISPSGQEVGPFLPIEQAALSQVTPIACEPMCLPGTRCWLIRIGARCAGGRLLDRRLQTSRAPVDSYRAVVVLYACIGGLLCLIFRAPPRPSKPQARAHPRRRRLFARLFRHPPIPSHRPQALGVVCPRFVWRRIRRPELCRVLVLSAVRCRSQDVGALFFAANIFAGLSALVHRASRIASACSTRWSSRTCRPTCC